MSKEKQYLVNHISESSGTNEGSRLYAITCVYDGTTEVVVEKTIKKSMPIQELAKAQRMYEAMNGGGGRRLVSIEDIVDISTHQKEVK